MALGTCDGCHHTYVVDDEVLPERHCPRCHQTLRTISTQEVAARLRQARRSALAPEEEAADSSVPVVSEDGQEHVIDLHWQATAGKWTAVLVNQASGERHEVCSTRELQQALEGFLAEDLRRDTVSDVESGVTR